MDVVWFSGWNVVLRTAIGGTVTYFALIALLRVAGPRTLAKWYAFDLIVTVALGSTFANGVLSQDISIVQALTGFVLLVVLQFSIAFLAVRLPIMQRIVNPQPVLLVLHGELQEGAMRRNRVTRADVCKAARASGRSCIEDLAVVVLEPDGTFTVIDTLAQGSTSALDDIPGFRRERHETPPALKQRD